MRVPPKVLRKNLDVVTLSHAGTPLTRRQPDEHQNDHPLFSSGQEQAARLVPNLRHLRRAHLSQFRCPSKPELVNHADSSCFETGLPGNGRTCQVCQLTGRERSLSIEFSE